LKKHLLKIFIIQSLLLFFAVAAHAQTVYDWTGAVGTDWTTAGNWSVGGATATVYPGQSSSTDIADVGVNVAYNATNANPILASASTITIDSFNWGDNLVTAGAFPANMSLTINGTLNITNTFLQKHSSVGTAGSADLFTPFAGNAANFTNAIHNFLQGSGTLNCAAFTIGDNTLPTANHVANTTKLKIGNFTNTAGVTLTLNVSGDFTLFSPNRTPLTATAANSDAEFSLAAGTLNLTGQIKIVDVPAPGATFQYLPLAFFSVDLLDGTDSPVLNLFNASPLSIPAGSTTSSVTNSVQFYNTLGGTGVTTVNYAGTGPTQDILVYRAGVTPYQFVASSPQVYRNIIFSGTGTKSVTPSTPAFSVKGDFTLAAGTEIVDIGTNSPTISIGGNYSSANGTTLNKNSNVNLTITGTTNNAGVFNQQGSGTITLTGLVTNSGTYNQSGTGLLTMTGAVTNTGTIKQTNTGAIKFTNAFNNSGAASLLSQTGAGIITFSSSLTNGGNITQSGAGPIGATTVATTFTNNGTFTQTLGAYTVTGAVTNNGALNLGTAAFTMAANYTNNGTFTQSATGTAFFTGGAAQTLQGGASGTPFSNVTFSGAGAKSMTTGIFSVASTGVLKLSGSGVTLNVTAATLTLNSNATSSAAVDQITGTSKITGNVTVQRYLSGLRGYRLLASPVFATAAVTSGVSNNVYSLNYVGNSAYLTGTTGTSGGFDQGVNPTIYIYREDVPVSNASFTGGNFRGINNILTTPNYNLDIDNGPFTIPVSNGFLFFFRGNKADGLLSQETQTNWPATPATLSTTGTLNQGPVIFRDWYTANLSTLGFSNPDIAAQGFNLVGNPYASTIDLETYSSGGINMVGLSPFIYELNPVNKNYGAYEVGVGGTFAQNNSSRYVASGQGFFVLASGTGGTLTFNETAKAATSQPVTLFMGKPADLTANYQYLRLQLAKDSINTDDMIVGFNDKTKSGFDVKEDALYRIGSGAVSLASFSSDNRVLAINKQPLNPKGQTIPLKVGASTDGTYTLNMKSIVGIPQILDVWLKDNFKKDSVNMRTTKTYSFTITKSDTNTFGSKRFSLVTSQNPALAYKLISFTADKVDKKPHVEIVWTTQNEQNYVNFSVERSTDNGKTFEVIGSVSSSGLGTYSLVDKNPVNGNNQYRLKQEDYSNTITYSNVVNVEYSDKTNVIAKICVFPNPATNNISLTINPKSDKFAYNVRVTNSTGMIVRQATITQPTWKDNVSNLLTGTYLVQVVDSKDNSVIGQTKFVKL
jgi:hypothetical protein